MNRRSFDGHQRRRRAGRAQEAAPAVPLRPRLFAGIATGSSAGKMTPGADAAAFDDSKFQRVTLPIPTSKLPWHSFDDKAYEFVSFHIGAIPRAGGLEGKRVFADFAGVMTASKVTVNGHHFEE